MTGRDWSVSFWILVLICAVLFLPSQPALAQLSQQGRGGTTSGQFCATYNSDSKPEDCSFTSMQMCQESVSGLGGWCAPQAGAPVTPPPPLLQFPALNGPARVPPPPVADQPAVEPPMTLPDAPPANGY